MTLSRGKLVSGTALCAVLAVCSIPAQGAGTGRWFEGGHWYLGASVGQLQSRVKRSRFSRPPIPCIAPAAGRFLDCRVEVDDESLSLSGFGGYQFNRYVAVEGGYADLPDSFAMRSTDPNQPPPGFIDVRQDSDAAFLRGVFTLPVAEVSSLPWLSRVSVSGALGVTRWSSDMDLLIDSRGSPPLGFLSTASRSDDGVGVTYGARVSYDVTDQVTLSGAWDHYRDLGKSSATLDGAISVPTVAPFVSEPVNTVKTDVDVFSVQFVFRFR